jgi:UDP-N-acetylglucosamine:LPS N-acetylglucosamine transferase
VDLTPSLTGKASSRQENSSALLPQQLSVLPQDFQGSGDNLESRPKVTLVYFDAGGGHRAATNALCSEIREKGLPWIISTLNLQELLDQTDIIRKITGLRIQDFYNSMIKKGWTLGTAQLLKGLHLLIRLYHKPVVELLKRHWHATQPEMVVSLIPNFNLQIAESLREALPGCPFVTVLTDMADYPPHFWIEREAEFVICGSQRAVEQAHSMGHAPEKVFATSGMILNPAFYDPPAVDRFALRESLGLHHEYTTGIVLFGGQGAPVMARIARRLNHFDKLQLIIICGRNQKLEAELRKTEFRISVLVEGFTTMVNRYMQISDFFIGKPGPASVSEALLMGLPVIVERNAWTLPQERFNADWILEKKVGLVVENFRHIRRAVEQIMEPATMARYKANALRLHNRAVFEIPRILETILERSKGGAPARTLERQNR